VTSHREREGDGISSGTAREAGIRKCSQQFRFAGNLHSTVFDGSLRAVVVASRKPGCKCLNL
jgi:hypothetical protein